MRALRERLPLLLQAARLYGACDGIGHRRGSQPGLAGTSGNELRTGTQAVICGGVSHLEKV